MRLALAAALALALCPGAWGWTVGSLTLPRTAGASASRLASSRPPFRAPAVRGGAAALRAGLFDGLFGQQGGGTAAAEQAPPAAAAAPPPDTAWQEIVDEASGSPYYWNKDTGETSWDRPAELDAPPAPPAAATGAPGAAVAAVASPGAASGGGGMPKLYDGWFSTRHEFMASDGETERRIEGVGELVEAMNDAVSAAVASGVYRMEVTFPPVPNLEEVDFGTAINQRFSNEIREFMGLEGKEHGSNVRRNLVDFANHYWACKLAEGCGGERSVYIAHCDQTNKAEARKVGDNVWVGRMKALPKPVLGEGDFGVCVNPGPKEQWEDAAKKASAKSPFVFLNSISGGWTYELGGPLKDYEQVFYLKRISKGWVYRKFPGPWQALVETPEGDTIVLETYKKRPLLRDVSKLVRGFSFDNFGIMNDRYAKGFGGRL